MVILYADENFNQDVVDILVALGHDVLTALLDHHANQGIDDAVILERATFLGRAVITSDRLDYHRLHRTFPTHAGIITCTREDDVNALAARVHTELERTPILVGKLIRIVRPSMPRPKRPAP